MTTTLVYILLIIVIGVFLILFIKSRIEISSLKRKYGSIIDVDIERSKIQKDIESLTIEKDKVKAEFLDKKQKLSAEYDNAHKVFEALQKEIGLLEESIEMIEFGVYKPHFDFESSDEYRRQLESLQDNEKEMIRSDKAVICAIEWSVSGSKSEGRKMTKQNHKLMLRAFNGECDAALAKVRWDNALKMEERIKKAFETINKSGEVNRSHITREYLELKIKELRLTFEYQEKIHQEKEEQRQIQQEMREEEQSSREIERAREDAEKEETRYQKALEKAREDVLKASGDKVNQLNDKISQLETQLKDAQELKQRAISRAQITKSGHVYIISNIGSFGENVYKIGMTRRLEPLDRVKELGDSSVPFTFDVHGLIYSDNAPELENKIQKQFDMQRINLVNPRREFFSIKLDDIEKWAKEQKINLRLTKIAEAREYRETISLREKGKEVIKTVIEQKIPETIDTLFSKDE